MQRSHINDREVENSIIQHRNLSTLGCAASRGDMNFSRSIGLVKLQIVYVDHRLKDLICVV
jgi:hypothetical protein